jgi:hypothetical protein
MKVGGVKHPLSRAHTCPADVGGGEEEPLEVGVVAFDRILQRWIVERHENRVAIRKRENMWEVATLVACTNIMSTRVIWSSMGLLCLGLDAPFRRK